MLPDNGDRNVAEGAVYLLDVDEHAGGGVDGARELGDEEQEGGDAGERGVGGKAVGGGRGRRIGVKAEAELPGEGDAGGHWGIVAGER